MESIASPIGYLQEPKTVSIGSLKELESSVKNKTKKSESPKEQNFNSVNVKRYILICWEEKHTLSW